MSDLTVSETDSRRSIVTAARSLFDRKLTHGSTGNISVRRGDHLLLVTPTGSSLGTVKADELSTIDLNGNHLDGPKPSKEAFLHAATVRARPTATAVVHTHSTFAAAVSCLAGLDPDNALPPLTAYFAMRVGRLPLLPYHAPGDTSLGQLAEDTPVTRQPCCWPTTDQLWPASPSLQPWTPSKISKRPPSFSFSSTGIPPGRSPPNRSTGSTPDLN
jgi:hypothetical protein